MNQSDNFLIKSLLEPVDPANQMKLWSSSEEDRRTRPQTHPEARRRSSRTGWRGSAGQSFVEALRGTGLLLWSSQRAKKKTASRFIHEIEADGLYSEIWHKKLVHSSSEQSLSGSRGCWRTTCSKTIRLESPIDLWNVSVGENPQVNEENR